jgi:hypothetical protein
MRRSDTRHNGVDIEDAVASRGSGGVAIANRVNRSKRPSGLVRIE